MLWSKSNQAVLEFNFQLETVLFTNLFLALMEEGFDLILLIYLAIKIFGSSNILN